MKPSYWFKWILLVMCSIALVVITEVLIEYNWLGRHWTPSRMWVNLVLVSLGMMILMNFVLRLFGGWFVIIIICICWGAGVLIPYLFLEPLFENPAINWAGGQEIVFLSAVWAIAAICWLWSERLAPTPDGWKIPIDWDDFFA